MTRRMPRTDSNSCLKTAFAIAAAKASINSAEGVLTHKYFIIIYQFYCAEGIR